MDARSWRVTAHHAEHPPLGDTVGWLQPTKATLPTVHDDIPAVDRAGRRWRATRYAVGWLCAIAAVYLAAINLDWSQVLYAFERASLVWTPVAILSVLLTLCLVTLRWGLVVGGETAVTAPLPRSMRWGVLWNSVVLGQAVNILVPLRFGEGARLIMTSRGLHVPVGRVMVSLALERAFDIAAFATIVATLVLGGLLPQAFRGVVPAAATLTVATIGAALLFVRFLPSMLAWLRTHLSLMARATAWLEKQESAMREGWADMTQRHQLGKIAMLTAAIPITAAATNYLVFRSFDLPVPAVTALVLLVVLQIGTAVVSVPGNVGVFHYLTVVTLAAWDVPQPTAVAVAIVLHIVSLGPKVVLAAFSARNRLS